MSTSLEYKLVLDNLLGAGPIGGSHITFNDLRNDTYMDVDNNINYKSDSNNFPVINQSKPDMETYINNYYANYTGRGQLGPTTYEQVNLQGNKVWQNNTFNDLQKVTTKETTEYSYSGNANRTDLGNKEYTYDDLPKITTKQTTDYSYSGNANRTDLGNKEYTYDDLPKITTKQTTDYSYSGNANRTDLGNKEYTYDDLPKITTKQTTDYSYSGNANRTDLGNKEYSYVTNNLKLADKIFAEDYVPGSSGYVNLQANPDEVLGETIKKLDNDLISLNGPGSLYKGNINGEYQQQISSKQIGNLRYNANKLMDLDNRQTAHYSIKGLKDNPLSIHTNNLNGDIPSFFSDSNRKDNSIIKDKNLKYLDLKGNKINPNALIVNNQLGSKDSNISNPLLFREKIPTNELYFPSKSYSGEILINN